MTSLEFDTNIGMASKYLKPFAIKLTKNLDDANDLIQDTLLKAVVYKEKFALDTNLKAWLYTIMKNTFITSYNRLTKNKTFVDLTENQYYIDSVNNSVSNLAYSEFVLNDIKIAKNTVDETYLVPFEMYFKGYKYHEISDKLNIPIGTVKNRIFIARKELKNSLMKMEASIN